MPEPVSSAPAGPGTRPVDNDTATTPAAPGDDHTTAADIAGDRPDEPVPTVQVPKLCRGCREQMPAICHGCARKTSAYCRRCRQPEAHTPAPTPPRHRRDDLDQALSQVMRAHPMPDFGGVTGWTAARLAVHLPDHPPATILAAARRLTTTGTAALLGHDPERYRPTT
jgi:hypothetical protein